MADRRTAEQARITRCRLWITVHGERVGYELYSYDARTEAERVADRARGMLAGCLVVVLPGHGQRVYPSATLVSRAAHRGRAGVAWLVDIDPPAGGDPVKAQVLGAILRRHWPELAAGNGPSAASIVLFGWSHGGGEALRAATTEPGLLHAVVGLCPTGLIERSPAELVLSFLGECIGITIAVFSKGWAACWHAVLVGADTFIGIGSDLGRTRSFRRVLADIDWAACKVTGPDFAYAGTVGLVFAAEDSVVRWRDVFPDCATPGRIPAALSAYHRANFSCARALSVYVLPGNHLSPGMDVDYAATALALADQLIGPDE